MPVRFTSRILCAVLLSASFAVLAQGVKQSESYRYRWLDNHGQIHFSDSLTADAIKNGYDVLNNNGLVIRHVQRQLTPQERKLADARKAREAAARATAEREHAEDMQMLEAYPNERVFRDAQQASIDEIDQTLHTTKINLHAQEQNLADLLAHAAQIRQSGKPVPSFLSKRIDTQRAAVKQQRATLVQQQQAREAAVKRVAERIARYRKLRTELDEGKL